MSEEGAEMAVNVYNEPFLLDVNDEFYWVAKESLVPVGVIQGRERLLQWTAFKSLYLSDYGEFENFGGNNSQGR